VAAAEHALAVGKANPCGLFAYLIRVKLWRYLTQADEDRASAWLKAHRRGPAASLTPPAVWRPSIVLAVAPPGVTTMAELLVQGLGSDHGPTPAARGDGPGGGRG
jgi:hypothetical protein